MHEMKVVSVGRGGFRGEITCSSTRQNGTEKVACRLCETFCQFSYGGPSPHPVPLSSPLPLSPPPSPPPFPPFPPTPIPPQAANIQPLMPTSPHPC